MGNVKTPTVKCSVTTLIKKTLGEKVNHPAVDVNCMSISETAAEKWVALTRRIATAEQRTHYYDQALVRHLYDLAMINKHFPLAGTDFVQLASEIVESDREHFKTHSDIYHQDPISAIQLSLTELCNNPKWQENWDSFMNTMVYGEKPSFEAAIENLELLSGWIVTILKAKQ